MTCFNVFSSDVSIIFSSHDEEGGGGKANVFVVKGPKKNFKQRSGRTGCLNVRVAFKSKTFFFGWVFFFLLSQFLGSLRLVN